MKQIADDLDSKITPLLNADQLKEKFQEIRKQHRRELVEKLASELVQEAEYSIRGFFDQHAQRKK